MVSMPEGEPANDADEIRRIIAVRKKLSRLWKNVSFVMPQRCRVELLDFMVLDLVFDRLGLQKRLRALK